MPSDPACRDERCNEVYNIQVQALLQWLQLTAFDKVVIGVSGGLDSTHALLVCAKAMDTLGLPRSNIFAYTMPGFATSDRTLKQARELMEVIGCTAQEIDIRPSCVQMLSDIGHPHSTGSEQYDITYENVQAGERTSHLFRLANFNNAIVIGTGDLSELALGWCTYGVGDHMSHYNVNASVPKTLITHPSGALGRGVGADRRCQHRRARKHSEHRYQPGADSRQGRRGRAEDGEHHRAVRIAGLQHVLHTLRFGFAPSKVAFLELHAWRDREQGAWPEGPNVARNQYTLADIRRNLRIFLDRFFRTSQFKRSCIPNAPKVGSGGSLSSCGDWSASRKANDRAVYRTAGAMKRG